MADWLNLIVKSEAEPLDIEALPKVRVEPFDLLTQFQEQLDRFNAKVVIVPKE